jgi:Flp pilus assembly protein protease CpaA
MYKPFFPNLEFAWSFLAILAGLLVLAALIDTRRAVIPKWVTLSMLAFGVVVSVARGAWLGSQGDNLWLFASDSPWMGALDGFLFALVGFLAGFGMIFLMWLLGTCGGGDVKLFAALGTWLGPIFAVYVLAGSLLVLFAIVILKLLTNGVSPSSMQKLMKSNRRNASGVAPGAGGKMRITYSLPVCIATIAILLWVFRFELHLTTPPPVGNEKVQANAH